jgi:hypothetical protein
LINIWEGEQGKIKKTNKTNQKENGEDYKRTYYRENRRYYHWEDDKRGTIGKITIFLYI